MTLPNEPSLLACSAQLEEEAWNMQDEEKTEDDDNAEDTTELTNTMKTQTKKDLWTKIGEIASLINRILRRKKQRRERPTDRFLIPLKMEEELVKQTEELTRNRNLLEQKENELKINTDSLKQEKKSKEDALEELQKKNNEIIRLQEENKKIRDELTNVKQENIKIQQQKAKYGPIPFTLQPVQNSLSLTSANTVTRNASGFGNAILSPIITEGIVKVKLRLLNPGSTSCHGFFYYIFLFMFLLLFCLLGLLVFDSNQSFTTPVSSCSGANRLSFLTNIPVFEINNFFK